MELWKPLYTLLVVLFCCLTVTSALDQRVLSTVIYTRHGERTPFVLPGLPTLTTLGARQLFAAGTRMRNRYLTALFGEDALEETTIRGITSTEPKVDEINILSSDAQWVTGSAQAFMQGLYPPSIIGRNDNSTSTKAANGTNINAPLNGIKYPNILTASANDVDSIWVRGTTNCPAYTDSIMQYYNTSDYQFLLNTTSDFYKGLQTQFLNGVFADSSVGYFDAYYIYDYLNYANTHNATVAQTLKPQDLTRARLLADDWVFAMRANTSGDSIRTMAGRTLATRILQAFYTTINTQGDYNKMNLIFGGYEPMVSFAALAGLTAPQNSAFYYTPAFGSSFIFELISLTGENLPDSEYPGVENLFVRFYYQNGTDDNSSLVMYPLFGRSPSQSIMSLTDFIAAMNNFKVEGVQDWCNACSSYSFFCPYFTGKSVSSGTTLSSPATSKGLNPAVAGVIGALVALVVAALIFAAIMLLGGFRVRKQQTKRQSNLGGFKGAEKLASDLDLTIPKGGAAAAVASAETEPVRGHERVGSWELRDQAKSDEARFGGLNSQTVPRTRRASFEDDDEIHVDPYATPVKPHDRV